MSEIIKIVPIDDCFRISWITHLKCNYDCMYCPPERHTDRNDMLTFEQLQNYWTQIYEKTQHRGLPYKIAFSGGEPTINRNLSPFVEWLRTNYQKNISSISTITNGSASESYYLKLLKYMDTLTFSSHTEYIDEGKFWSTVLACDKYAKNHNKKVMVLIMEEHWAADRIAQYMKFCQDNQIAYSVNKINYSYQTRSIPIFRNEQTNS